jgi:acyl carrier protein
MNETIAIINQRIADAFGFETEDIQADFDLRQDLNASELELADFIAGLEHEFGIEILPDEVVRMHTVADLYELLLDKLNEVS